MTRPEAIAVVTPYVEDFTRLSDRLNSDSDRQLVFVQQHGHIEHFKIVEVILVGRYLEVPGLRDLYERVQNSIERN